MIQLQNSLEERFVIMSLHSKNSLTDIQLEKIARHGKILSPDISTIENTGGGSARCMIAENFLPY